MPRDLTDLMESAVASAPPESHHAADITRLAERHQRRRTTFVAGAAALALVAATGGVVALTRGGPDSTPEPVSGYRYDQKVALSAAVPASTLPGYRVVPYTLPSVQRFGHDFGPLPTYQQIDAQGRLIVEDFPSGDPRDAGRVRLYDGPGLAPRPLQQPPSPGTNSGHPLTWLPSFLDDGGLIWRAPGLVRSQDEGFRLTDLDGGHDRFVRTGFHVGNAFFDGTPGANATSVVGDRVWFLVYDHNLPHFQGSANTLYTATFSGSLTKVADDVAVMSANDGMVAWVTTSGEVITESAQGGGQHHVDVPLTPGCRLPSPEVLQSLGVRELAVNRSLIALAESCGSGKGHDQDLLLFDQAGRLLVHVTGLLAINPTFGADDLVFQGLVLPGNHALGTFRYDLLTGTLARLDGAGKGRVLQDSRAAGRYVLWYDPSGGHVAQFAP
jgi:hypothetical protein